MTPNDLQPGAHVPIRGDEPAVIMADSGVVVTYRELDERSKRLAGLLRAAGLRRGDHLAILLENHPRYFEVYWAAQRIGLYTTPINWHLHASEIDYIVQNCDAKALVTSARMRPVLEGLESSLEKMPVRLMMDGIADRFDGYEDAILRYPAIAQPDEVEGSFMFYSSGTTGRPKGIKPPLAGEPFGAGGGALIMLIQHKYGFSTKSVYLCPAPLYHAAPLGWSTTVQRLGGTVVVMERFDAARALELIERHRVTHAQFVPTHFVRMLKLSEAERRRFDLSSLQMAVHAAAPCPVDVKHQMLDWWGPIIEEYYAGSEGNGFCAIGPKEWLSHPGSVGTALRGTIHILDEDGSELRRGATGQIWFESDTVFEYHKDPEKTAMTFNSRGWSSLGDIGHLDDEGFLYLTDRASHMIISGGVNIYPQETEDQLVMHPDVADVAVIGVPNQEMGEEVKAVVVLAEGRVASDDLAADLIAYSRARLAHYKCPVSIDFVTELPRLPTGKLRKGELRKRYWPA